MLVMPDYSARKLPRRRAIPLVLIPIGICGLVGCAWIPFPEHGTNLSQRDFRPLLRQDSQGSPIKRGVTTRAELIAALGRPEFENTERRQIVYKYDAENDIYIRPLCFSIEPGERWSYAVLFKFDANGVLSDWDLATDRGHRYGGGGAVEPAARLGGADASRFFRNQSATTNPADAAPTTQPSTR